MAAGAHTLAVEALLAQEVRLSSGPRAVQYLGRRPLGAHRFAQPRGTS